MTLNHLLTLSKTPQYHFPELTYIDAAVCPVPLSDGNAAFKVPSLNVVDPAVLLESRGLNVA